MCGRYTLTLDEDDLIEVFEVAEVALDGHAPRYNIAPTQHAPVVVGTPAGRRLGSLRWGLVPPWADDPSVGSRMINARSETVAEKPAFRDAFEERRCLVPADGFYEWRSVPDPGRRRSRKVPQWIHRPGREPFAFAGLWERWRGRGDDLRTFTILTTDASDALRPIHDRVPVVLDPDAWPLWLGDAGRDELEALFEPPADDAFHWFAVSTRVNTADLDEPSLIDPVEEQGALDL